MHHFRLLMPLAMAAGAVDVRHNVQWDNTPTGIASIGNGSVGFTSGDSTRVLTVRGSYSYHCGIHGTAMSGVIVVQ